MCYGLILGPEGLEPAQPRRILQCRLWHQADGYVAVPLSTICLLHGFIHASTSFVANGTNTAESRDCRRMCGARFQSWCNSPPVLLRIFVPSYLRTLHVRAQKSLTVDRVMRIPQLPRARQ